MSAVLHQSWRSGGLWLRSRTEEVETACLFEAGTAEESLAAWPWRTGTVAGTMDNSSQMAEAAVSLEDVPATNLAAVGSTDSCWAFRKSVPKMTPSGPSIVGKSTLKSWPDSFNYAWLSPQHLLGKPVKPTIPRPEAGRLEEWRMRYDAEGQQKYLIQHMDRKRWDDSVKQPLTSCSLRVMN